VLNKVILAIDEVNFKKIENLLTLAGFSINKIKLGLEFFLAHGPKGVERLQKKFPHIQIFLDLKLFDIPTTVSKAIKAILPLNIWLITIHLQGGEKMIKQTKQVILERAYKKNITPPKLIGVSVLTSFSENDLKGITNTKYNLNEYINNLSQIGIESGIDGIVCSPLEAKQIRKLAIESGKKDLLIITPGIRLEADEKNDQTRTATPKQAIENGADYIVIGRSITNAKNPSQVIEKLEKTL
jgi:orotidine-5'-phosphate decarboxylase